MTEKLYWLDPLRLTFEARCLEIASFAGSPSIVVDRTAFYPEAGGQLGDRGTFEWEGGSTAVVDVQIDDAGRIHHLVDAPPPALAVGASMAGAVDEARRRDHMSQHTGQHMLSRALLDAAGAETLSSRLGATESTIDVPLAKIADADVAKAEDAVNAVVLDDRPVRALHPTPDELAKLPLRRDPKVDRDVRVIEVEGFDFSPCGGTHCVRTGQVGPVRVVGVERHKGGLRLTFLAGKRAIDDYRRKDAALGELARGFTCGPLDVATAVAKLRSELKARGDALSAARGELMVLVADALLVAQPPDPSGATRVVVERAGDDVGTVRALATRLAARADVVAFVASRDSEGAWLAVVERGKSSGFDAGAWWKRVAVEVGGRGGGKADRAEGRLPAGVAWSELARR